MSLPVNPLSARRLDRLDRYLDRAVADLFRYDARLRGLDLHVEFRGAVAHLTGAVAAPDELDRARDLIGRVAGVLAVWDRVEVAGRAPVCLDVGCGDQKQYPDNIGVDVRRAHDVDLVADLTDGIPLADRSVDRVYAVHVLEHLIDFLPLVDECHRVLRPGGLLHVLSPWWHHVNAVTDPTHVRLIDVQTIKGICVRRGTDRHWYPRHASCDGATVFADLTPGDGTPPPPEHLARFFD